MELEIIDNVNKPSHYQGRYGMESIDALRNFMTPRRNPNGRAVVKIEVDDE